MKTYLTKERLEELKKELADLKFRARKEIAERFKQAKESGDLSENSEFHGVREDQTLLESRISQLEDLIREAVLIQKPRKSQIIKIGSMVKAQKNNQILTYTIVGSQECQPDKGFISNESPLGKAFLGKKVGDRVRVETPSGKMEYVIIEIE